MLIILLAFFNSKAQIIIDEPTLKTEQAYRELVKKTLIGSGVLTGHFEVKAAPSSIGLFEFDESELVTHGLILSTGDVKNIAGPNDTTNTSSEFFTAGDEDLANLIGRLNGDAVSIEFDFIPYADSVGFYYFFASEEYPEYVGKGFNDAFAFLIKVPTLGQTFSDNLISLYFGIGTVKN
ncbi:MAG: choice-of-anchor L domain-containing protein [Bacteroidia bacterium]